MKLFWKLIKDILNNLHFNYKNVINKLNILAICEPICEPPSCHTVCQEPKNAVCEVKCEKPVCEIKCPDKACEAQDCPKCVAICK